MDFRNINRFTKICVKAVSQGKFCCMGKNTSKKLIDESITEFYVKTFKIEKAIIILKQVTSWQYKQSATT